MDEYIKRDEVLSKFNIDDMMNVNGTLISLQDARETISNFPAADVAPLRHGKWILEREPNGKPYCFHCSVCDDDFHYIGITVAYDYCPNCGAKMDIRRVKGEEND